MKITLNIPTDVIANMVTSAMEGGDPVTTAQKGGWCNGIYWKSKKATPPKSRDDMPWYAQVATFEDTSLVLEVHEVADENEWKRGATDAVNLKRGALAIHKLTLPMMQRGLEVMAKKYPHWFSHIVQDNTDAPTADLFLQCALFGEEKYA